MLVILDYDAGNIESVRLALRHVGGTPEITANPRQAEKADRLVFPGVGSAGQCMTNLRSRGFDKVIRDAVAAGKPVLAICIGMQLLFDRSEEDGGIDALGIMPGQVVRFIQDRQSTKIPHMGWNRVETPRKHPLIPDEEAGRDFYFVHSFYVKPAWCNGTVEQSVSTAVGTIEATATTDAEVPVNAGEVYGITEYSGVRFMSMAGKGSLFAAQFHPEKSGEAGLDILRRFIKWNGRL